MTGGEVLASDKSTKFIANPYVVCGAYRKVKALEVRGGEVLGVHGLVDHDLRELAAAYLLDLGLVVHAHEPDAAAVRLHDVEQRIGVNDAQTEALPLVQPREAVVPEDLPRLAACERDVDAGFTGVMLTGSKQAASERMRLAPSPAAQDCNAAPLVQDKGSLFRMRIIGIAPRC